MKAPPILRPAWDGPTTSNDNNFQIQPSVARPVEIKRISVSAFQQNEDDDVADVDPVVSNVSGSIQVLLFPNLLANKDANSAHNEQPASLPALDESILTQALRQLGLVSPPPPTSAPKLQACLLSL